MDKLSCLKKIKRAPELRKCEKWRFIAYELSLSLSAAAVFDSLIGNCLFYSASLIQKRPKISKTKRINTKLIAQMSVFADKMKVYRY